MLMELLVIVYAANKLKGLKKIKHDEMQTEIYRKLETVRDKMIILENYTNGDWNMEDRKYWQMYKDLNTESNQLYLQLDEEHKKEIEQYIKQLKIANGYDVTE